MFVHASAVAEAVCPARLIGEVQVPETQIECSDYLGDQLVVLFGFMGTFGHFLFPFPPLPHSISSIGVVSVLKIICPWNIPRLLLRFDKDPMSRRCVIYLTAHVCKTQADIFTSEVRRIH